MNIGSLYKVKQYFWLLFPTKATASGVDPADRAPDEVDVAIVAAAYSKRYNCEVTYFSPDSIVVFLEEDGKLKKVLTSDGLVGWTCFSENYNHCFEEVKTE